MNHSHRLLQATIFCILSVIAVVLHFWFKVFWGQPLSGNSSDWAAFADYFGGMINPIIAIANLVFLIYISFQLATREDQRSTNSLRHEAMQLAINAMDMVPDPTHGLVDGDAVTCVRACDSFSRFCLGYAHLFLHGANELVEMESLLYNFSQNINSFFIIRATLGNDSDEAESLLQTLQATYAYEFRPNSSKVMRKLTETF